MRRIRITMMLFLATIYCTPAIADKCNDRITDETKALSTERPRLDSALTVAREKGIDARVLVLDSFHRCADGKMCPSLTAYKDYLLKQCSSWRSGDSGMKNNLLVMMVAPSKQATGLFYGDQWREKLDSTNRRIIEATMNPRFRDGNIAGGIIAGLGDIQSLVSLTRAEANRPVTINQASDNTKAVNFGYWMLASLVLGLIAWGLWYFFHEKERRRAAQSDAKTQRGRCTAVINGFDSDYEIAKAKLKAADWITPDRKVRLQYMLDAIYSDFGTVSTEFSGVNRSASNPDASGLSVQEYGRMANLYGRIANSFQGIQKRLSQLQRDMDRREEEIPSSAPQTESVASQHVDRTKPQSTFGSPRESGSPVGDPYSRRQRRQQRSAGYASPRAPAPTPVAPAPVPSSTTVVHTHTESNDGFLTGLIVGNMLGGREEHHHHHHDRGNEPRHSRGSDPIIMNEEAALERRSPPNEHGNESSFGRSSTGGGNEVLWGTSSQGGGDTVAWGGTSRDSY